MGRILLVFRLVRSDVRRHPGRAAMLLVSLTVATGMLALGGSLSGATETLYRPTRAVTRWLIEETMRGVGSAPASASQTG